MHLNEGIIYIVCEGTKTENYFLDDLYLLLNKKDRCAIDYPEIVPAPKRDEDVTPIESRRPRGGRSMVVGTRDVKPVPKLSGSPPLNWVNAALDGLKGHSEAWVLFDHDDHPARDKAFETVRKARTEGKNINVAFSSRSFEYYMLQHFEYLFHRFEQTECHGVRHICLNCCHPAKSPLSGACDGNLGTSGNCCINGYARKHGYWVDSKKDDVMTLLPSLWRGINNALRVKWESIFKDYSTPVYNRNPYIDTYRMVLRFMGMKSLEFWKPIQNKGVRIELLGDTILLANDTNCTYVLSEKDMLICRPAPISEINDDARLRLVEIGNLDRVVVSAHSSEEISLHPIMEEDTFAIINLNGLRIFVTYLGVIPCPMPQEEIWLFD